MYKKTNFTPYPKLQKMKEIYFSRANQKALITA
jgi:hypothetical protein